MAGDWWIQSFEYSRFHDQFFISKIETCTEPSSPTLAKRRRFLSLISIISKSLIPDWWILRLVERMDLSKDEKSYAHNRPSVDETKTI